MEKANCRSREGNAQIGERDGPYPATDAARDRVYPQRHSSGTAGNGQHEAKAEREADPERRAPWVPSDHLECPLYQPLLIRPLVPHPFDAGIPYIVEDQRGDPRAESHCNDDRRQVGAPMTRGNASANWVRFLADDTGGAKYRVLPKARQPRQVADARSNVGDGLQDQRENTTIPPALTDKDTEST